MRPEDPRVNRVEQVGQISRGLKILAGELNVPVLGLSQLSRAPELRPDKRPILSDLRESGQIEADSDVVVFIYRDEVYNDDGPEGEAELVVAKHRNGPIGTVKLAFINRFAKFADPAPADSTRPVEQRPGEGPPLADLPEIDGGLAGADEA
jgi:replicative DNA helicase